MGAAGQSRLRVPADHKSHKRMLAPETKRRRRLGKVDRLLTRVAPDTPGAVALKAADPPRRSGPPAQDISPPWESVTARIRALKTRVENGEKLNSWDAHHIALALRRAKERDAELETLD